MYKKEDVIIENQKLMDLLVKIEGKIDCFLKDCNANKNIAKDIKELIHEKLKILEKIK